MPEISLGSWSQRTRFRYWMAAFIAGLFMLLLASVPRAALVLDVSWWEGVSKPAPVMAFLRSYWMITTPIIILALIVAAVYLLRRQSTAHLVAIRVLALSLVLNLVGLVLLSVGHLQFTRSVSLTMGVPMEQVAGFELGVLASIAELTYIATLLTFAAFSPKIRETFGPVSWKRLLRSPR